MAVHADALAASYAACRDVVKAQAKNFYYGMRLTPEDRRDALYAAYAWMRFADDAVDDAADSQAAVRALAQLGEQTAAAIRGGEVSGCASFWPGFIHTLARFPAVAAPLQDMLLGLSEDARHSGYETLDDLDGYCYRVGGTVGQICTIIWGVRPGIDSHAAHRMAAARGRAFQMVNIIRDVGEDARIGRCYVPREVMRAVGIDAGVLAAWSRPRECARVIAAMCDYSREQFRASALLDEMIDPDCRGALWALTAIYTELLSILEGDARQSVRSAARVSTPRKLWIMTRASMGRLRRGIEA